MIFLSGHGWSKIAILQVQIEKGVCMYSIYIYKTSSFSGKSLQEIKRGRIIFVSFYLLAAAFYKIAFAPAINGYCDLSFLISPILLRRLDLFLHDSSRLLLMFFFFFFNFSFTLFFFSGNFFYYYYYSLSYFIKIFTRFMLVVLFLFFYFRKTVKLNLQ